jgi:hypothetical protein
MGKVFELNDNEEKLYNEFCEKHTHKDVNVGAIGGNISVRFTVTSIGDMPTVRCGVCGEEQNITDYDKL